MSVFSHRRLQSATANCDEGKTSGQSRVARGPVAGTIVGENGEGATVGGDKIGESAAGPLPTIAPWAAGYAPSRRQPMKNAPTELVFFTTNIPGGRR